MAIKNNHIFFKLSFAMGLFFLLSASVFAQGEIEIGEEVAPPQKTEAQSKKESEDSIADIDNRWKVFFIEKISELDNLYQILSSIDADTTAKVDSVENDLKFITDNFADLSNRYRDRLTDNENIKSLYKEYHDSVEKIRKKIEELRASLTEEKEKEIARKKEREKWFLIISIAAGVLALAVIPTAITQIPSKLRERKQNKQIELASINAEWQGLKYNLNAESLPQIEILIVRCKSLMDKKPKKLYRNETIVLRMQLEEQQRELEKTTLFSEENMIIIK